MNQTNTFFWIIGGLVAWWAWNEYQKQTAAQQRYLEAKAAGTLNYPSQVIRPEGYT